MIFSVTLILSQRPERECDYLVDAKTKSTQIRTPPGLRLLWVARSEQRKCVVGRSSTGLTVHLSLFLFSFHSPTHCALDSDPMPQICSSETA